MPCAAIRLPDDRSRSIYPQHKALLLFVKVIEVKELCGKSKTHNSFSFGRIKRLYNLRPFMSNDKLQENFSHLQWKYMHFSVKAFCKGGNAFACTAFFKVCKVDDLDAKLGCPVSCDDSACLCGDNGGLGALSAEAVTENGKLV